MDTRSAAGRMFTFGTHEIVVGHGMAIQFDGISLASIVPFGGGKWTVVGYFDAGGTG